MPIGPTSQWLEKTLLNNTEEHKYQNWVKHYKVKDVNPKTGEPWDDVFYDMRGYWKANQGPDKMAGYGPPQFEGAHGPDTWKQHGHPTFSQESTYSRGPYDGGMWIPGTEKQIMPFPMAVSHKRK